jgi:hypothetical protein
MHMRTTVRRSALAALGATALLAISAAPAVAHHARTVAGTAAERNNTTTPRPPGGDQCSNSPDSVVGLYDFSWACYAHDVCYQNHRLNGHAESRFGCDNIFLGKMRHECEYRHGWWSPARYTCYDVASTYYGFVRAFGARAYNSWNDPNTG